MTNLKLDAKERTHGGMIVMLDGRLDSTTAPGLDLYLADMLGKMTDRTALTLDLGSLDYISSMGLSSILKARKLARGKSIAITLINAQPQVEAVFRMTNFGM